MKKLVFIVVLLLWLAFQAMGQRYVTRNGNIRFFSQAPLENIEAVNRQVSAALDAQTGEFVFMVVIRSFQFEKALMQEHFNDNFMESHDFPNASFKGEVTNIDEIDFGKPGIYDATVEGDLTIRGITHRISEKGTLEVKDDMVIGNCVFMVLLDDYDIRVPRAVIDNIASEIEVTVNVAMEKM
jgi:hypothetical protein